MGKLLKGCNDGRFLRVEERLFRTLGYFLKHNLIGSINVSSLTTRAKVWQSTFYDHFKNIDDALICYDHRYDAAILKIRKEIEDEKCNLETAIMRLLFFIYKHKSYYGVCLHRQDLVPIFSMAKIFRPIFSEKWSNFGREKYDLCFKIFCGELYGVIYYWGNVEKFNQEKIKNHVANLSKLARNTTHRLL